MTGRTRWLALFVSTVVTALSLSPVFGGKPNAPNHGACVSGVAQGGQVGGRNSNRGGGVSQASRGWCSEGPADVPPAVEPTPTETPPAALLPTPTPTPTPDPTPTPTPDPTPTPTPHPTPTPTPDPTPTPTPTPTPMPTPFPFPPGGWEQPPQGDWVGNYGVDGYALLAWDASTDLVWLPNASLTLDQGGRFRWNTSTTSVRALEDPTQTMRRATQWFHSSSLRLHLTFTTAYSGILHLYAVDWDGTGRRQVVWVDDGSGPQSVAMTTSYHDGAWMHFPVNVAAGGTVTIRAERVSGQSTLSGLFLGEAS